MALIMLLRSWPARPTKGRPCASSSAPGPSPTNRRRAVGEYELIAAFVEGAAGAVADIVADGLEGGGAVLPGNDLERGDGFAGRDGCVLLNRVCGTFRCIDSFRW